MTLSAPQPIDANHDTSQFDCGHPSLDAWLARRALANELARASRTYVVCDGKRVVGYYCLAMGSVEHEAANSALRRNMPDPIPAVVIGRLAVDRSYQGKQLGADLLADAVLRSIQAAQIVAARVMLCHAIDEQARDFHLKYSFVESGITPLTMLLDLAKAAAQLGPAADG